MSARVVETARMVETARGPVEVAVLGTGPAVLIAHGMPGSWQQAIAIGRDLQAERTVVLVTRPGYGGTPLRSGRTAAEQADLYAALIDALAIDDVVVVGVSGGGPSALAFAQRHPARTRGLVLLCALAAHLIHVPWHARLGARLPAFVWGTFAAFARWRQRTVIADPDRLREQLRAQLSGEELARFEADPALLEDFADYMRSQCEGPSWARGFRNDVRAIVSSGRAPTDAITAPTIVVHGDADTVVPIASAEHHASAITGATLQVLPGASHGFPLILRETTLGVLRSLQ